MIFYLGVIPLGFSPSICSGVVAKLVKAKFLLSYQPSQPGNSQGHSPVMLETTAAVHPGGSGGAVVNSDGHMIGLVTRYVEDLSFVGVVYDFERCSCSKRIIPKKLPFNILISH